QVPQRSEIGQRECETILIFIPHGTQGEAAEFQAYSAAIPVIRTLYRGILQKPKLRVETNIGRRTETLFAGMTVAQQEAELVKKLRPENNVRIRGGIEHTSAASTFT